MFFASQDGSFVSHLLRWIGLAKDPQESSFAWVGSPTQATEKLIPCVIREKTNSSCHEIHFCFVALTENHEILATGLDPIVANQCKLGVANSQFAKHPYSLMEVELIGSQETNRSTWIHRFRILETFSCNASPIEAAFGEHYLSHLHHSHS